MSTSRSDSAQASNLHEDPIVRELKRLLQSRVFPKTICPSEVARALSKTELEAYDAVEWREVMPEIRKRVWELRDAGEVEVMQKGEVLSYDVGLEEVKGPIRVRFKARGA